MTHIVKYIYYQIPKFNKHFKLIELEGIAYNFIHSSVKKHECVSSILSIRGEFHALSFKHY